MQNEDTKSTTPDNLARTLESEVRRRLTGRASKVAEYLGWSDSTMSRWKDRDLAEVCKILAALGISFATEGDGVLLPAGDYKLLKVMAERGFSNFLNSLPESQQ